MRYCINCGAMNDTDANFCSGCGKKFENADNGNNFNSSKDYSTGYKENTTGGYGQNAEFDSYGKPMSMEKYRGYGIASLILGICSIVFSFFIFILPLAAGIVGLVLANKLKDYGMNNIAKAGRILCIIGIILSAIIFILFIIAVIVVSVAMVSNSDFYNYFSNIYH